MRRLAASIGATLAAALGRVALAGDELGPPELPGPPLRVPFPWGVTLGASLAVVAVAALVIARSRRPPPRPAPALAPGPERPSPRDSALARLAALRAADTADTPDADAFHDEVADTVRTYVAETHNMPGRQTTTEEFEAGLRDVVPAPTAAALVAILQRCDLARFARIGSSAEARSALLHDAETLVRSGAGGPGGPGSVGGPVGVSGAGEG